MVAHKPPPRRKDDDEPKHEPSSKSDGTKVTYRPLDIGDPHTTVWDGTVFEANVPKVIKSEFIIGRAKTNPWFEVEGHPRAKRVKPTAEPVPPAGSNINPVALDDKKMVEVDD